MNRRSLGKSSGSMSFIRNGIPVLWSPTPKWYPRTRSASRLSSRSVVAGVRSAVFPAGRAPGARGRFARSRAADLSSVRRALSQRRGALGWQRDSLAAEHVRLFATDSSGQSLSRHLVRTGIAPDCSEPEAQCKGCSLRAAWQLGTPDSVGSRTPNLAPNPAPPSPACLLAPRMSYERRSA